MKTDSLYIGILPHDVNYVTRILEGYEYLGVLTTVDAARAVCRIYTTADTRKEARDVLASLPVPVRFLPDEEAAAYEK